MNNNNKRHKNRVIFKCDILIKNINFNKQGVEGHSFIKFDEEDNPKEIMCSQYSSETTSGDRNYCEILKGPCIFTKWQPIYKDGIDYEYNVKK